MKEIGICTVFLVLFVCADAQHRGCSYDEFYNPTTDSCDKCPACPAGKEISKNCSCVSCISGLNYNDGKEGRRQCKNCQKCQGKSQIKACTVKSDAVCKCPKGKYETSDGKCKECSYCCDENWEQSKKIESACKEQGLGRCICRPSYYCRKKCPNPTMLITTTVERTTTGSPTISKTTSSQNDQKTGNSSKTPTFQNSDYSDPKAEHSQKEEIVYRYLKPGWIVFICLGSVVVLGAVAFLSCRKQTRKQIHGFCCRKYAVLSPDIETTSALVVESHYEESAPNDPEDGATPIPPGEEPVPRWYPSPTTEYVYCNCGTREKEELQMECECIMDKSETSIEKLVPISSSTETFSDEPFHYSKEPEQERQISAGRISPSSSTSSRSSCPQSSHFYCGTCSSSSNCVTPSQHSGRSTDRMSSFSNSSTLPPSHERSPDPGLSFMSATPLQGRSPTHRCVAPSTCLSPASSCERTPIPPSLPALPSHYSLPEDQEICNQSSEYAQSQEPLTPVSVEVYDKEVDRNSNKVERENVSPTSGKGKKGRPVVRKNSSSPKKGVACARNRENRSTKHSGGVEEDVTLIHRSDGGLGYDTTGTNVNGKEKRTFKEEENDCIYRPIQRCSEDRHHRCSECCPPPDYPFFKLIERERTCLKDYICKELNKSSDYKEAAIYFRVDHKMKDYEVSSNPSERVLDNIKASHPDLELEEFEKMLREKPNKRLDIIDIIQNHHISCTLCQRNRFDTKA